LSKSEALAVDSHPYGTEYTGAVGEQGAEEYMWYGREETAGGWGHLHEVLGEFYPSKLTWCCGSMLPQHQVNVTK